jgi:hypothetical protein
MSRGKMKAKRVMTGIVVSHQMPLAEFVYDERNAEAVWRIWLNYDGKRECGTYLELYGDGSIRRETFGDGGVAGSVQIAPKVGG